MELSTTVFLCPKYQRPTTSSFRKTIGLMVLPTQPASGTVIPAVILYTSSNSSEKSCGTYVTRKVESLENFESPLVGRDDTIVEQKDSECEAMVITPAVQPWTSIPTKTELEPPITFLDAPVTPTHYSTGHRLSKPRCLNARVTLAEAELGDAPHHSRCVDLASGTNAGIAWKVFSHTS